MARPRASRSLPSKANALIASLVILLGGAGLAFAEPAPPSPTRWVTDGVSLLSQATSSALDARLEAYQHATGHQLLVWIAATTGGVPGEEFSVQAFKAWRVGQKGLDDGLILFIFTRDHRTRIEVGYGLEGIVTDAQAARILREVLGPRLLSGDADAAVIGAVDGLVGLLGGEAVTRPMGSTATETPKRSLSLPKMILLGLLALAFLVLLATHPRMALFLLASIASGGFGRRGSSGGAGFSGGGGRSGGGGASGSW